MAMSGFMVPYAPMMACSLLPTVCNAISPPIKSVSFISSTFLQPAITSTTAQTKNILIRFIVIFLIVIRPLEIDIKTYNKHLRIWIFVQADIVVILRICTSPWAPDEKVLSLYIEPSTFDSLCATDSYSWYLVCNHEISEPHELRIFQVT